MPRIRVTGSCSCVEPLRRLARVRVACRPLRARRPWNVDVVRRRELHRVLAVRDLVVVEGEPLPHAQPGVVDQHRDRPVVGVVVDGPVGEDDVGPLGLEDLAERLVVVAVDDRVRRRSGPRRAAAPSRISQAFAASAIAVARASGAWLRPARLCSGRAGRPRGPGPRIGRSCRRSRIRGRRDGRR